VLDRQPEEVAVSDLYSAVLDLHGLVESLNGSIIWIDNDDS
jgi:hypothetical protein